MRSKLTWISYENYRNPNALNDDEEMKEVKSNDQVKRYTDEEMTDEFNEETSSFVDEEIDLKTWELNESDDENNMNIIEISDWR